MSTVVGRVDDPSVGCFGNNRAAILIVFDADQVSLKQKATGMGTPVAINSSIKLKLCREMEARPYRLFRNNDRC